MKEIYFGSDNILTSLGLTSEENADAISRGVIGIVRRHNPEFWPSPVPLSLVSEEQLNSAFNALPIKRMSAGQFTRLEKMFILSIRDALRHSDIDLENPRTLLVISSTKGNIDLLNKRNRAQFDPGRIYLWKMAEVIADHFRHPNRPVIICNACISGSVAILTAARLIREGLYDHAVVTGGDLVSEFVVSGFQSFQALSPDPCRPFDAGRDGLSLGEGIGTIVLSADPGIAYGNPAILYLSGAISNDANHISGPSRDGEGLWLSIRAAMKEAGIESAQVDFISAHGTGTSYNDEMESLAMTRAGLTHVPMNSFKGYIGHTLGAAGIIESVLTIHSMRNGLLFKTAGFESHGVTGPVNILDRNVATEPAICLKTASGFGGCNATLIFGKA